MDVFLHIHLGLFLFDLWLLSTKPHHFSRFSVLPRALKQRENHSEGENNLRFFALATMTISRGTFWEGNNCGWAWKWILQTAAAVGCAHGNHCSEMG